MLCNLTQEDSRVGNSYIRMLKTLKYSRNSKNFDVRPTHLRPSSTIAMLSDLGQGTSLFYALIPLSGK